MTRILQISDPHFGTEVEPVVQALLHLSHDLQPDLVLLSGDLTQRARRSQFAAVRSFVQALERPVLAVPGNHDIPLFNVVARLLNPYGGYRRAMGATLEPVFETPGLLAIGVNSTRPTRHERGQVDAHQITRVAQRLRRAHPDCLRIVVLHHPVRAAVEHDRKNLLIGREKAVPAWVEAGADLILGGHIHLPYVMPALGETSLASASLPVGEILEEGGLAHDEALSERPPGTRQAWVVQAGTALSRRVRGGIPNSVNVIDHAVAAGRHNCAIQRWDYDEDKKAFDCVTRHVTRWSR
ncbi:metallophosphoesterase [Bordetella sp. 15P40C-2]|uniref:metallophosphoesterase family protein n=1 Tax=Bordetella sp. 15P40C-2 TaxID=2572246 RepID=UPI0013299525|nr:metallophosphoesterase [Bordetella sp. 15P40C-2]MVW73001.1 metallophosphoesterase [Bordetella sp. 15P40C-2]